MKNKKILFLFIGLAGVVFFNFAQAQTPDSVYRAQPKWIDMMYQQKVLITEAKKAFDLYWEFREKPEEVEGEMKNIYKPEEESKDREQMSLPIFAFEYRRFKWWYQENLPWIDEKGYTRTQDEKLVEWQKQQKK